MKTLITAAALLALTSPAFASSAAEWDCGKGVKASSTRGEIAVVFSYGPGHTSLDVDDATKYQLEGSRHFALKWDFRVKNEGTKVWLNGKACKQTN